MSPQKPCRLFLQGKCHYGARCKFSHDNPRGVPKSNNSPAESARARQPPRRDTLQEEWRRLLQQAKVVRFRQSRSASDRFFHLAFQLIDGDLDSSKDVIRQLAGDDGLLYIRDLADRCAQMPADMSIADLWQNQLKPLFKLVNHDRIVESASLEQEVAIIHNYLLGVGGQRMDSIFTLVLKILYEWAALPMKDGSKMSAAELSLGVLSKIVDCNTNNMVNESFTDIAKRFVPIVLEPVGPSDEFSQLQSQKYLDYINRRLGVGDSIPAMHKAAQTPIDRAEFVLRRDLPGNLSPDGPRHDNDFEEIADIRILPTESEIASSRPEYLPTNDSSQFHIAGIRGRLDREFRLLREDTVGQLRDIVRVQIETMRNSDPRAKKQGKGNLRTYTYENPKIHDVQFEKYDGVEFVIRFSQPISRTNGQKRKQWWLQSKRLQPGSLVCVAPANGAVLFFVVAQSTVRSSEEKRPGMSTSSNADERKPLSLSDDEVFSYVNLNLTSDDPEVLADALRWYRGPASQHPRYLVEFPGVLLPSFVHTLESLQKMSQRPRLPFTDIIAAMPGDGAIMDIRPPQYTTRPGFSFDLRSITHNNTPLSFSPRDAIDPQKLADCSQLDFTQAEALLNTLSREISLVQGPPGTGKSFTGEKIIKVLLSNKERASLGPILCVCYTNHALDQLLEHLLDDGIKQIIRIGSRSKSEKLEKLNLRSVAKNIQRTRSEKHTLWQCETSLEDSQKRMNKNIQELRYCATSQTLEKHLEQRYPWHHRILFGPVVDEEGFQVQGANRKQTLHKFLQGDVPSNRPPRHIDELLGADLFGMTNLERNELYDRWLEEISDPIISRIISEDTSYHKDYKLRSNARDDIDLRCLQAADIVGVTTTGLARSLDLLSRLKCKVMLCEEAGEVLEAHLLTALLPSVEHAILIGDHLQLRPQIQNYELQSTNPRGEQYSLDVSLFERLVKPPHETDAKVPFCKLDTQRRMHPSISNLIRNTLYPTLEDSENVTMYPEVRGMKQRLFWLHHEELEASALSSDPLNTSHTNDFEIEMTTALVLHLIRQGSYGRGDIAVITPYLGQLHRLRGRMSKLFEITVNDRDEADLEMIEQDQEEPEGSSNSQPSRHPTSKSSKVRLLESVRVATVDNFQGEEAKVIIISLVRSNPQNRCGFLSTSNRINVLLSRAQHGMFIIGNSTTYRNVPMWSEVINMLQKDGNFGSQLQLQCPRHRDTPILVSHPDHFLQFSPEGGCRLPCDRRLDCGHICKSRCHSEILHDTVKCLEPCPRPQKGCDHPCPLACSKKCPPRCNEMLTELNLILPCGHIVSRAQCWQVQNPSLMICKELVKKTVPGCEHTTKVPCHTNVKAEDYRCTERCNNPRPCGHNCKSLCHQCKERKNGKVTKEHHEICSQVCGRKYTTCQHSCASPCHAESKCPPCSAQCEVRCSHSKCSKPCHEPCTPCAEQSCASRCPHTRCTMPCAAPCDWVPCSKRCEKKLACGHQCPSICGESCPSVKYCQKCCSQQIGATDVDFIMGYQYHDIDLDEDPCIFPDCGHFLTRSNMDGLMDMKAHYKMSPDDIPVAILRSSRAFSMDEVKACPSCRGSLRNIARYGRIVRRAILDEATKKFVTWSTTEFTNLAMRLLNEQEKLEDAPKPDGPVIPAPEKNKKMVLSFGKSRALQLDVIRGFVEKGRYTTIHALYQHIGAFRNRVSREEQPFQRVADFVQYANRQERTDGQFTFDESVIQAKNHLQATALLMKCESVMFQDFTRLYQSWKEKPDVKINLSHHFKDCEDLVTQARESHHPRQEVEGHLYYAHFCAIARGLSSTDVEPAAIEDLKTKGKAHLDAAREVIASQPSAELLKPEIDAAETLFNDGVTYTAVSKEEMRAVYRAMATEFSGTGHWYVCENDHPFTVGECGMPMQLARCPECNAPVGGQNHNPAQGVRHADEVEELARDVGMLHV
ncbi:hypothetical protein F5X96DRAFT_413793 [Biscogniauxia mediterranea]|nr:hypothetical protein F5X96DRAFT_413793 [Biscogniauxia mediterranea]